LEDHKDNKGSAYWSP